MNTIPFKKCAAVKMVAHRGCSGLEQENTLPAFVAAGNRSYFGIETDVHKTKDGELVLMHDGNTRRTSGVDMSICDTDFDTLRALPLLDKDGKSHRADLRIPALAEYIRICHRYEKVAVLELKSDFSVEEMDAICDIIQAEEHLDDTVFISFSLDNLIHLRVNHKDQPAQYLVETFEDGLVETLLAHNLDLDIYFPAMTKERVALLHEKGITVNVWTVDDPARAEELVAMGIDMITSNILE